MGVSVHGEGLCTGEVSVQRMISVHRGFSVGRPSGIRKAGGTYPTGMVFHCCLCLKTRRHSFEH